MAKLIVERRGTSYDSVRDVWLRTGLSPRVLERLADADAFASLGLTRREALWAAKALGRVGDRDDDLPLFALPPPARLRGRSSDAKRAGRGRQQQALGALPGTALPNPPPQGRRQQSCCGERSRSRPAPRCRWARKS